MSSWPDNQWYSPQFTCDCTQAQIVDLQTQLSDRANQLSQPNFLPCTSPWSRCTRHSHESPNTQRAPHASVTPSRLAPPPRVHGSTAGPHPVKRKPGSSLVNPHAKRYGTAQFSGRMRPSTNAKLHRQRHGLLYPAADEHAAHSLRTRTTSLISTATAPSEFVGPAMCIDGASVGCIAAAAAAGHSVYR